MMLNHIAGSISVPLPRVLGDGTAVSLSSACAGCGHRFRLNPKLAASSAQEITTIVYPQRQEYPALRIDIRIVGLMVAQSPKQAFSQFIRLALSWVAK